MEYLPGIADSDVFLVVTLLSQQKQQAERQVYPIKPSKKSE